MRGFVYTLIALIFSLVAISILFMSQGYSFYDSYPIYLLEDRIGYNVLNVNGISIDYQNGILFSENFPHTNLSIQLKKLELFYDDFTKYKVKFENQQYLKLYGPINYTQISNNESKIDFNSNNVSVSIKSNCNLVNSNYSNGTTYYDISIYNSSGKVYSLSGKYKGYINCTSFKFNFNNNYLNFNGSGNVTYHFNISRGLILSNINYTILYKENNINSKIKVRI